MMETFTFGQTPRDVIENSLPRKYKMELVRDDMVAVLTALHEAWVADECGAEMSDRWFSLRTSILETLDIEEV